MKRCLVEARGILDAIGEAAGRHPKPRPHWQAQAATSTELEDSEAAATGSATAHAPSGIRLPVTVAQVPLRLSVASGGPASRLGVAPGRDSPESDPPGPSGRGRIQPDMQRLSFDDDRAPVPSRLSTRRTILLKSGPTTNPNRPRILAAAPSRPPFPVHLSGSCTRGAFDPATLPSQRHAAC